MKKHLLNTLLLFISLSSIGQEIELIMPVKFTDHTCEKNKMSPPLYWKHELENVVSYLLIIESKHDITGNDIHFIAYNIPGKQKRIPSGIETHKTFGGVTKIGLNSNKKANYFPPCNEDLESASKTVSLSVYALDKILTEKSGLDLKRIKKEIKDNVLGKGTLNISL